MSDYFEQHMTSFTPYRSQDRAALTRRLQIIGVSGTATTFGALHLGLQTYDRSKVDGLWLPARRAAELTQGLLGSGDVGATDPAMAPGIGHGRADLILSGAAILMAILRIWPVEQVRIADRGLREGMLYGLLHQRRIAVQ